MRQRDYELEQAQEKLAKLSKQVQLMKMQGLAAKMMKGRGGGRPPKEEPPKLPKASPFMQRMGNVAGEFGAMAKAMKAREEALEEEAAAAAFAAGGTGVLLPTTKPPSPPGPPRGLSMSAKLAMAASGSGGGGGAASSSSGGPAAASGGGRMARSLGAMKAAAGGGGRDAEGGARGLTSSRSLAAVRSAARRGA